MSALVFLCPAATGAKPGDVLVLDGSEGLHATQSLRLAPGESVDLVDGKGTRALGTVVSAATGRLEVTVTEVSLEEDRPVVLVQALAKGGRDEAAIEAATELGATRVVPWQAFRSIVRWEGQKAAAGRARWAAIAVAASKAARRAWVPVVSDLVPTTGLEPLVSEAVSRGSLVLLLDERATAGIRERIARAGSVGEVWVIVGPEGSVAPDEAARLTAAGALPTLLGRHILRSGTAGPAAIAALKALVGDWTPPQGASGALG